MQSVVTVNPRADRIKEVNETFGTSFYLGQAVTYEAEKGRGTRAAIITDGVEGAFLKIMRDGETHEYPALWEPGRLTPE